MMILKRKVLLISALLFLLLSAFVYLWADTMVETVRAHANHAVYEHLDSLNEAVDLIVLAKSTGDRENVVKGEGMSIHGYTMTEIEVQEILKNDSNTPIKSGDRIKISEPYYIVEKGITPGKYKKTFNDYTEIQDDSWYILYLKWWEGSHSFAVHALSQGKYNVDGHDTLEAKTIDSHVQRLKDEVLQKYQHTIQNLEK